MNEDFFKFTQDDDEPITDEIGENFLKHLDLMASIYFTCWIYLRQKRFSRSKYVITL